MRGCMTQFELVLVESPQLLLYLPIKLCIHGN